MTGMHFKLAQVRKRRRLSQEALAQIAGVRVDTVRALESGTATAVRFATLTRICDVLHCQPGDILEVSLDDQEFPVLGGPDEDEVVRARLRYPEDLLDGPTTMADVLGARRRSKTPG